MSVKYNGRRPASWRATIIRVVDDNEFSESYIAKLFD